MRHVDTFPVEHRKTNVERCSRKEVQTEVTFGPLFQDVVLLRWLRCSALCREAVDVSNFGIRYSFVIDISP